MFATADCATATACAIAAATSALTCTAASCPSDAASWAPLSSSFFSERVAFLDFSARVFFFSAFSAFSAFSLFFFCFSFSCSALLRPGNPYVPLFRNPLSFPLTNSSHSATKARNRCRTTLISGPVWNFSSCPLPGFCTKRGGVDS